LEVPIRSILESKYGSVFEPEDIPKLEAAYTAVLRKLGLLDRADSMATAVAKAIIQIAKYGERDPQSSATAL